jgi:hypothetical protein
MRKINSFILFFFLLLSQCLATSKIVPKEVDIYLVEMFDFAKSHNLQNLKELQDKIKQMKTRTLTKK